MNTVHRFAAMLKNAGKPCKVTSNQIPPKKNLRFRQVYNIFHRITRNCSYYIPFEVPHHANF
jgi:hypothetical protein